MINFIHSALGMPAMFWGAAIVFFALSALFFALLFIVWRDLRNTYKDTPSVNMDHVIRSDGGVL